MNAHDSILAPIVADAVGELTGLPAWLAPAIYAGPPTGPAVLVQLVGTERADYVAGTVSGSIHVAVYGATLDLSGVVESGRGYVKAEHREHTSGTLVKVQPGTPSETVLPNGLPVYSVTLAVTGYGLRPELDPGAFDEMEVRGLVGAIATGITERFGSRVAQFGTAQLVSAALDLTAPGVATVTGEIRVIPRAGRSLASFDVPALIEATTTCQIGTASALGRITAARVLSTEARQDGRASFVLARVELTAEYTPAISAA